MRSTLCPGAQRFSRLAHSCGQLSGRVEGSSGSVCHETPGGQVAEQGHGIITHALTVGSPASSACLEIHDELVDVWAVGRAGLLLIGRPLQLLPRCQQRSRLGCRRLNHQRLC